MIAKQIYAPAKGRVDIRELEIRAPEAGEVQVRAEASLISPGTERAFILGMENTSGAFPLNLGYSFAGTVLCAGEGVTEFKAGDRVAGIMHHQSAGNCAAEKLVHVPEKLTAEQAAFVRIGVIAMQGVRKARIELGESCAVFGMGLIGQTAMQLAKQNGAYPVIAIDRVPSKLKLARVCGADAAIDAGAPDSIRKVIQATGGQGARIVIESTGLPNPINDALTAAEPFGRVIILGSTRGDTEVNFYRDVHKKALTIIGAHITSNPLSESYPGYWTFQDNANAFLALLAAGKIDVLPLISRKESFHKAQDIYKQVLAGDPDYVTTLIQWKEA